MASARTADNAGKSGIDAPFLRLKRERLDALVRFDELFQTNLRGVEAGEGYNNPYMRHIRDLMIHNQDKLNASKRIRSAVTEARDNTDKNQGAGS